MVGDSVGMMVVGLWLGRRLGTSVGTVVVAIVVVIGSSVVVEVVVIVLSLLGVVVEVAIVVPASVVSRSGSVGGSVATVVGRSSKTIFRLERSHWPSSITAEEPSTLTVVLSPMNRRDRVPWERISMIVSIAS